MEFENDIFISYAHIDNETLTEEQKGWITAFHQALEVRLGQLLGKRPNIFRDPKLQGNDVFGDRLEQALPKTATLISVFSPRYVRSEWCVRELEKFIEASEHSIGLRIGTKSRIFKLVKTPIPLAEHPEPVQDLLGYEFFAVDPETGRPHELSQDAAPDEQRAYWAKLNDIAYDVCDLLTEIESLSAAGAPKLGAVPTAAAGVKVFLAETSYDLREQRSTILRFLRLHGHTVLPDQQLPLVADECETLLRAQLAECDVSIHLLGANYGIVPEGTTQSLVSLQNELAIARGESDAGFQRLIWISPELATHDERQQKLLEEIRTDARIQQSADILEIPIPDLQIAIKQKLRPLARETTTVYLAQTSFELNQQRLELMSFLQGLGHTVLPEKPLPLYADGCREFLEEQLARCTMSIHMVGDRYGVVPENTRESFITLQAKMAFQRRAAADRFVQLVWIPPGLATDDERHQRFIDEIRADPRGAEVVEKPLAELKSVIVERLKPPAEAEEPATSAEEVANGGPARVYLICEQRDQEETRELEDFLFDRGFEVVLPLFEGDETEIRTEHEESLRNCDAVIIYYGAGAEAWQRRMLREVKKCAGYGRNKPPPAAAIYVAPPETPQKKRLRTHEALVLQPGNGFSADDLKPLLNLME